MALPAQAIYDRLAPVYDRRWAYYTDATLRATLEGLEPAEGERVLDLAAGTGELARRLQEKRSDVFIVELDLSRQMLLRGRRQDTEHCRLQVQSCVNRLPLASGSFDRVVCSNSFHHFHAPRAALAEMRRVLKPRGLLTMTDWCEDFLSCKLCSLYLRLVDSSFQRSYTLVECQHLLEAAGFNVQASRRFKIDLIWGLMRLDATAPDELL